jgi:hypothetical protein
MLLQFQAVLADLMGMRLSANSFFVSTIQGKIHRDLALALKSRRRETARANGSQWLGRDKFTGSCKTEIHRAPSSLS